MTDQTPRTEAGRRVYAELDDLAWLPDILAIEREAAAPQAALNVNDEYLCPNCVTPWKCNGPHIPEAEAAQGAAPRAKGLDEAAQRVVDAYRHAIPFSYISEETQLRDAIEMLAARLDEGSATPDQGTGEPR